MSNPLKWVAGKAGDAAKFALDFVGGSNFKKAGELIDMAFNTPTERAEARAELDRLELEHRRLDAETHQRETAALEASDTGQVELNKIDATRRFSWRSALGWSLVAAISWHFWIGSMVEDFSRGYFSVSTMPEGSTGDMIALLFGMLGLGAFRSVEKGYAMRQTTLRQNGRAS